MSAKAIAPLRTGFVLAAFMGCVGCVHQVEYTAFYSKELAPTIEVLVFERTLPPCHFIELGKLSIRAKASQQSAAIKALTNKAAVVGADAIILLGMTSDGAVAVPVGTMAVAIPMQRLNAVAIKCLDTDLQPQTPTPDAADKAT